MPEAFRIAEPPPELRLGTVHVWVRTRESAFPSPGRARERVRAPSVAEAWWLRVLAGYLEVAPGALCLGVGPYGKPFLTDGAGTPCRLCFSRSTTRGMELLAAAWDRPVGVDVEWAGVGAPSPPRTSLAEESELSRAAPADRDRARRLVWTVKEAWAKAVGEGLPATPRLRVGWDGRGRPRCIDLATSWPCVVREIDVGPYAVASVVCGGSEPLRVVRIEARHADPDPHVDVSPVHPRRLTHASQDS